MIHEIRAWAPAAAWAGLLFLASSTPDVGEVGLPLGDKLGHFGLYTVLGIALAYARRHSALGPAHWALILIGVLYGISDEWHQSFVPGREPELADLLADTLGVCAGYAMTLLAWNRGRPSRVEADEREP